MSIRNTKNHSSNASLCVAVDVKVGTLAFDKSLEQNRSVDLPIPVCSRPGCMTVGSGPSHTMVL
jgi:hypothetical protein